ncbi:MAG TPA: S41 family peptidase [Puia sp.]|nr:S41 family peptidase [Puia sp.]
MNLRLLTLIGILIVSRRLHAQDKYNFSFEQIDSSHHPVGWDLPSSEKDYAVRLDSANPQNGKYAVSIRQLPNAKAGYGGLSTTIAPPAEGSVLRLTGYIKTENVAGYAGLWFRLQDHANTVIGFKGMQQQYIHGTNDWKEYSIEIPYNAKAAGRIVVGALLAGSGKMWVDDLHLYVDGKAAGLVPAKALTSPRTIDAETLKIASDALTRDYSPAKLDQLAEFGRIWGFLKYYHPAITGGQFNCDSILVSLVPRILNATPQAAYRLVEAMIDSLGPVPACSRCARDSATDIRLKPDYGGIFTDNDLPASLVKKLAFIRDNYDGRNDSYYLGLTQNGGLEVYNESNYGYSSCPPAIVRLIALFRYWNIVEYYYPYRNLATEGWNNVLPELIPAFIGAANKNEYLLACIKMIAHVHDSHAGFGASSDLDSLKGLYMIPVRAKFVERELVVIHSFGQDSSALETGDIIKKIDGVPVDELVKKYLPLTTGSNEASQLRDLPGAYGWLMRSNVATATLTIEHNGQAKEITVQRIPYTKAARYFPFSDIPDGPAFKLMDHNIGYIVPDKLTDKDLDTIRALFKDTRGIIIDMRCYPSTFMPFTYGGWFKATTTPFAYFTRNSTHIPGVFVQAGPVKNGGPSADTYKGKLVIIVNSMTQSQAEYTTMALRSTPGAIVVGSTTAGADGNVSQLSLPGGVATALSGLGVFYPDWGQTQRVGVRIDLPVHQTIEGIRQGRDEYLEAAIDSILH